MLGNRNISELFPIVHTYLRSIRDIHHNDELLEKLYVNVWEREFDTDAVAAYAFNLPSVGFKEKNALFTKRAIDKTELFSSQQCLDPIFLYGHVGHGKTTYLRYLSKIRIKKDKLVKRFSRKVYFEYIEYTLSDPECEFINQDFQDRIWRLIFKRIFNDHNIILTYELLSQIFESKKIEYEELHYDEALTKAGFQAFLQKSYPNKLYYIRKIISWLLKTKGIKICFIVDNVDRHISQFSSQRDVIKLFQTIKACFIQIILSLRIANRGFQNNDYFGQYQPIPITLGLPDYGKLIRKRLEHIFNHLKNDLGSPIWVVKSNNASENISSCEIEKRMGRICSLIERNQEVKHSMEMLSNYVTREYLDIMINLFSSAPLFWHPLTGEKISYNERLSQGKFHGLFIYSLMLRNNDKYKEDDFNIPIINLFNNEITSDCSRFIRFYILHFLNSEKDSIFTIGDLINTFQVDYKMDPAGIIKALKSLSVKKCISIDSILQIESENAIDAVDEKDSKIMISPRGKYHLELS